MLAPVKIRHFITLLIARAVIRTAVVLAGGKGLRLRPLTLTTPKPLLPVGNCAILDHIISLLRLHGFDRIVVAVNYLGNKVIEHLLRGYADSGLEVVAPRIEPRDTADAVRRLSPFLDEDFIVTMGDVVTNIDLRGFADFHEKSGAPASVALIEVASVRDFGAAVLDRRGRIIHFMEKPEAREWYVATVAHAVLTRRQSAPYANLANSGFYAFRREILDLLEENPHLMDFGRHVFPWLLENGYTVLGWNAGDAYWIDVGRPQTYLQANIDMLDGLVAPLSPRGRRVGGVWVGEGTVINEGAVINPPAALGDYVEVSEGAVVGPYAVLGSDVKVGKGARVTHSVVMEGSVLGDRTIVRHSILAKNILVEDEASIEDSVVGDHCVISRGASLRSGALVGPCLSVGGDGA